MQTPMPPQPIRRPRRWPWIVALIVVFFIGFGLGHIGTGGSTAAAQNTTTVQTTATQAGTTPQQAPQTSSTSPNGPVNAGEPLKGTLTYEVPTSTKSFVLGFVATLGGQQVNWNITA